MMPNKETTAANVLRKIGGFVMAFTLAVFIVSVVTEYMIFNPQYWKTALFDEEVRSLIVENEAFGEVCFDNRLDEDAQLELGSELLDITFDAVDEYDHDIDEEWLEDLYDEYIDDDEPLYTKKEFIDEFYEFAEEAKEEAQESEIHDFVIPGQEVTAIVMWISLGVTCVIMVVLVMMHSNKMRPVRTLCLSVIWASLMTLPYWWLFRWVVSEELVDSENTEWGLAILDNVQDSLVMIIVFCVILIVVGIVLAHLTKNLIVTNDESLDDNDEYDGRVNDYE